MIISEQYTNGLNNYYGYIARRIRITENNIISKPINNIVEKIVDEVPHDLMGGMIVLSTDVNATKQSENKIVDFIKKKAKTLYNRLAYTKKIDKITKQFLKKNPNTNLDEYQIQGWTIGKFLNGRYRANDGSVFDENSISVELIYTPIEEVIKVAEELCRQFDQESVLVKDYANNKILFVDGEEDNPDD